MPLAVRSEMPMLNYPNMIWHTTQSHLAYGKATLIYFWAVSCPACKANMPALHQLRDKYAAHGLQTIAIHMPRMEADMDERHIKMRRRQIVLVGVFIVLLLAVGVRFVFGVLSTPRKDVHPVNESRAEYEKRLMLRTNASIRAYNASVRRIKAFVDDLERRGIKGEQMRKLLRQEFDVDKREMKRVRASNFTSEYNPNSK